MARLVCPVPLGGALAFAVVVVLAGACGESVPPPLGDAYVATDGSTGPPSLIGDAGPLIQNCGVGPDGGVCACADEPLATDPPTIYFVLDRSGSMLDDDKWTTVRSVIGQLVIALGARAKFAAAVFPDPVNEDCAPGYQVFPTLQGRPQLPERGDGVLGAPGPVDLAIISTLGHIGAAGGTPTAATLGALLPVVHGFGGKSFAILATDGGPNCDASATCEAATCTYNIEGDDGCTATGANCCDPANGGSWLSCLDAQPSVDAVTAFAAAGVPVYVIGIPGSEPYAALLDQLAVAGGTGRGSEPEYYAVTTYDEQALFTAMSQIAGKIAGSCTLTLDAVPPDPGLVNVFLGGHAISQVGPDGWTLAGSTVTILGSSCQEILDGDVLDVRVVAGCPTLTH